MVRITPIYKPWSSAIWKGNNPAEKGLIIQPRLLFNYVLTGMILQALGHLIRRGEYETVFRRGVFVCTLKMTQLFRGQDGIYLYISTSTFEGVSLKPYRMVN